ncbi:glycosyltransferase [Halorubrum sp. N11]|uniref:glycosyltransferase n=1 Tax=Halorubrum sp. N11 TaxID=3402276 RepID=UPI003EBB7A9A
MSDISVLWLQPSTGENISVRRERIAEKLRQRGLIVDIKDASGPDTISAIGHAICGGYDIIAGNVRIGLYIGYPLARLLKKPFLADVSDPIEQIDYFPTILYELFRKYEWYILEHSEIVVFTEQESYQIARDRNIDATLAKNSVNYDLFSNPTDKTIQFARNELKKEGINPESPIAIYPGRFSSAYHIKEILNSADIVSNWNFVFLGEGPEKEVIDRASREKHNVFQMGPYTYENIPGFLQYADVGLCLVNVERPLKILEYGAATVPVLGKPGKLKKEFSEEQIWYVNPTPECIASGLEEIRDSPKEANKRSKNLNETALKNSWESIADQYYELISQVIAEN